MKLVFSLFVLLVIALAMNVGCLDNHANQQSIRSSDCYTCHRVEYQSTSAPVHASAGCPTTCSDCHGTTAWQPALAGATGGCGHPENKFPIARGSHANIACANCHNAALGTSATKGANTDCTSCHPATTISPQHTGVSGYAYGSCTGATGYPCTSHNFCLTCHPTGAADAGHPQNLFPLPHGGATCAQCHDHSSTLPDAGGQNVLCVTSGCHTGAHHQDTNHHPGCLTCHPDGRGGG